MLSEQREISSEIALDSPLKLSRVERGKLGSAISG